MSTRYLPIIMATLFLAACSSTDVQTPPPSMKGEDNQQQQTSSAIPEPDQQDMQSSIVGTWQSDEDTGLSVRYGADGTVSVVYAAQGGMTLAGTWTAVDPAKEHVGVDAGTLQGMTVLRLNYPNASTVYVGIKNVTATTLQTVELGSDGGKVAAFTKMQ